MNRFVKNKSAIICLGLVILFCLACADHAYAGQHIYPSYYIEPGSPILMSEYPDGYDYVYDSDDFLFWESNEQYYDTRGFDKYRTDVYVFDNAYLTVFPSFVLKADLGIFDHPIRSFLICGDKVFIAQEYASLMFNGHLYEGGNVLLSRCNISGNSFERQDSMLLTNVGGAATLDAYTHNGKNYFWVGCGASKASEVKYYSTELGRVEYTPGTVVDSEDIKRLTGIDLFDGKMDTTEGDRIKSVESSLSSDKRTIIIHQRSFLGRDMFSVYDFGILNDSLSDTNDKAVPFTKNKTVKQALVCTFENSEDMPVEIKGMEISNERNGKRSVYVSAGCDANDSRLLKLYRYDLQGELINQIVIADYGMTTVWDEPFDRFPHSEINGLRIKGSQLQFSFRDLDNDKHQMILAVEKKTLKNAKETGPIKKDEPKSAVTYSFDDGKLTISGVGKMDRSFAGDMTIKEVEVEEGITAIRENAFCGCKNLKKVVLPQNGLRRIESGALAYTAIEEIELPESVNTIGFGALYTETIKNITLPTEACVTATGKASEDYPRYIGSGDGCTITIRGESETFTYSNLNAETIIIK